MREGQRVLPFAELHWDREGTGVFAADGVRQTDRRFHAVKLQLHDGVLSLRVAQPVLVFAVDQRQIPDAAFFDGEGERHAVARVLEAAGHAPCLSGRRVGAVIGVGRTKQRAVLKFIAGHQRIVNRVRYRFRVVPDRDKIRRVRVLVVQLDAQSARSRAGRIGRDNLRRIDAAAEPLIGDLLDLHAQQLAAQCGLAEVGEPQCLGAVRAAQEERNLIFLVVRRGKAEDGEVLIALEQRFVADPFFAVRRQGLLDGKPRVAQLRVPAVDPPSAVRRVPVGAGVAQIVRQQPVRLIGVEAAFFDHADIFRDGVRVAVFFHHAVFVDDDGRRFVDPERALQFMQPVRVAVPFKDRPSVQLVIDEHVRHTVVVFAVGEEFAHRRLVEAAVGGSGELRVGIDSADPCDGLFIGFVEVLPPRFVKGVPAVHPCAEPDGVVALVERAEDELIEVVAAAVLFERLIDKGIIDVLEIGPPVVGSGALLRGDGLFIVIPGRVHILQIDDHVLEIVRVDLRRDVGNIAGGVLSAVCGLGGHRRDAQTVGDLL